MSKLAKYIVGLLPRPVHAGKQQTDKDQQHDMAIMDHSIGNQHATKTMPLDLESCWADLDASLKRP